MRQGQSKRLRGRSRGGGGGGGGGGGKGPNPLARSYESNGPDVKIRGTAGTIADKYVQLSRDALSAGDPVAAENYMQHAEHYYRLLAAAQAQFQPHQTFVRADADDFTDVDFDDETGEPSEAAGQNGQPYGANGAPHQQGRPQQNGGRPNGYQGQRDDQRRFDRNDRRPYDRNERQDAGGDREASPRQDQPRQDQPRDESPRQEQPRQDPPRQEFSRPDDRRRDRRDRPERGERPARVVPDEQPAVGGLPAFITGGGAQPAPVEAAPQPNLDETPRAPSPAQAAPEPAVPSDPAATAASGDDDDQQPAARGGRRRRYGRYRSGAAGEDGAPSDVAALPDAPSE